MEVTTKQKEIKKIREELAQKCLKIENSLDSKTKRVLKVESETNGK